MFVTKGTKIMLKETIGELNKGDVFIVVNLIYDGTVLFKPFIADVTQAFMKGASSMAVTFDDFKKYFEIIEEKEEKKNTWSDWNYDVFTYFSLTGEVYDLPVKFRNNGRVVDFRTNCDESDYHNVKVKACCNEKHGDVFDLEKGISIADAKLTIKLLQMELNDMIDGM